MKAFWIVGLALAGCEYDHGTIPVDAAPPDTPNINDADDDGVRDDLDNCPSVANTDQRDHDGDDRGDPCDRCPHLASTDDPDGDGDSVGDACDPRPQAPGDRRVLWEPFDAVSSISGWNTFGTGGNWSVSNGIVSQTMLGADTILTAPGTFQRPYVATKLTVNALGPAAWIGVRTGAVAFTQYYACLMEPGANLLATSYAQGSQNDNLRSTWSGSLVAGSVVDLVQNHAATNTCDATQSSFKATSSTPVTGSRSGAFQFYTRDASASFDYVFVVEIGP